MSQPAHHYYPVLLDLRSRSCVVIGGGAIALEKVRGLLEAGARVRIVAPALAPGLVAMAEAGVIEHVPRQYQTGDLAGAFLVLAERGEAASHQALQHEAEERRVFLNVQDEPPWCSFIAPAIVRRGDLVVAISTSGSAPALAVRLRERLERELGPEYAELLDLARRLRAPLLERCPDFEERRRRWYELVDSEVLELLRAGEREPARRRAAEILGLPLAAEGESGV